MSETRDHRRRVLALARAMQDRGITVVAADAPGWPRPERIGGRRPDVLGFYSVVGVWVAGEVKRGPEVWACYSQLYQVAVALPGLCPPGACALFVLAVSEEWEPDAVLMCETLQGQQTWVTVWPEAA